MKSRILSGVVLAVLLAAGFVCVWRLQLRLDTAHAALESEKDELLLGSPGVLKKLSLEYAPLMGEIYWTRAVQYYGQKHHLHDQNLELLWPLLDITTTLDPELLPAYRFGSIFLSDSPPRGAGEPERAVTLLERGIRENPGYWRLYQDLGNVYYFDMKDYSKAAQAFETGSNIPGAMPWMKTMAAKIATDGESLETSYALWLDIYQTVKDENIHRNAGEHLLLLQAEMDMREIDRVADQYEKETGKRAKRMSELVDTGLLTKIPLDPRWFPYVLGDGGKAELNTKSPLWEQWQSEKIQSQAINNR